MGRGDSMRRGAVALGGMAAKTGLVCALRVSSKKLLRVRGRLMGLVWRAVRMGWFSGGVWPDGRSQRSGGDAGGCLFTGRGEGPTRLSAE